MRGGDGLFEVEPVGKQPPQGRPAGVDKRFRAFDPHQFLLLARSSRAIERKCADGIAFRFLAADQAPDFVSLSRFRRRHLDALADLFTHSLHLATRLGMVKMGRVALDGTKLEASASKHKAMSYGRPVDKEERIEAEIAALAG